VVEHNPVPAWLQIAGAYATAFSAVFTALGVLTALYVAVWREPRKARQDRTDRDDQAAEDRRHYEDQMAALQRAEDDRIAAQARRIVPEVSSADRFGQNIWLAHIENASTGVSNDQNLLISERCTSGTDT
jgi:hypothetical protein